MALHVHMVSHLGSDYR